MVVETKNPHFFWVSSKHINMLSTNEIMVVESKFNIFLVKYSHYEASLKKVKVPV
jgi:hypothetical protein